MRDKLRVPAREIGRVARDGPVADLTLIVSALILIGGLPYWMNYLPGSKLNNGKQGQSSSQGGAQTASTGQHVNHVI